jgi:O-methyltransferase involved in polyketide biosynthesis
MPSQSQDRGTGDRAAVAGFDTSVASPARIWNYWLGGKDNFAADREAATKMLEVLPSMPQLARMGRRLLVETVQELAGQRGVRQFLDIGAGLPAADNTHQVAQRTAPESRIVYADNDPVVIRHAEALLNSDPEGTTDYLLADLRDPEKILAGAARTLDFSQPVAILLLGVLHFIPDAEDPYGIVARLADGVPPGSFMVIGHGASDIQPEAAAELMRRYNQMSSATLTLRSEEQVARFFDGLKLIEPGLMPLSEWWQSETPPQSDVLASLIGYCGIGEKPRGDAA